MSAALVLQRSFRGRGALRTLFLVPYALPIYAGVITWSFMDHATFWLVGNNAFLSMAVVAIWRSWPFAFLMLMAGMQNISEEVYDAASVDGAGTWQQVRHITLGSLRPVNVVLLLLLFLLVVTGIHLFVTNRRSRRA
jgi:multiple sugar transport system permease protein